MMGAVASGHMLTTKAACHVLEKGGNAFDAVVAAGLASTVAEPTLTSLGGGGFMLAFRLQEGATLYDFFVDAPGRGAPAGCVPLIEPVEIRFKSSTQVFHTGPGSVAVPGMLKGLAHCVRTLCSMDMSDLVAPVLGLLEDGVEVTERQAYLIKILSPILTASEYGREIFGNIKEGRFYNPLLKEFLITKDPELWLRIFYGTGDAYTNNMVLGEKGGLLTGEDMAAYKVIEREPLRCGYGGVEVITNPPPSFGGRLLCMGFKELEGRPLVKMGPGEARAFMAGVMGRMNASRAQASGTTHISVIDRAGNAASMTSSNGSNSGCFLGSTGIMLNNMMGEEDLHPEGLHAIEPGQRVGSMMSPTILMKEGRVHAVLGSGGSKRIKTAMLQAVHNLVDRGLGAMDTVEAPRMHLDDEGVLQVEPGFSVNVLSTLGRKFPLNVWEERDLYFGGLNIVLGDFTGWGDSRRDGAFSRAGQRETYKSNG